MSGLDKSPLFLDQALASPDQNDDVVTLEGDTLQQLLSALMNVGITTSLIDLPHDDSAKRSISFSNTDIDLPHDDSAKGSISFSNTDIENGLNDASQDAGNKNFKVERRSSFSQEQQQSSFWISRKLDQMAKMRQSTSLDDAEEYEIMQGIYNMFWIAENWSFPFWYALTSTGIKFTLYANVLFYIYMPGGYRQTQREEHGMPPPLVMATQFLLIPTSIGITEELMWTMDVLGKRAWKAIEDRPHATRIKRDIAIWLRAVDGLTWLLIITSLMLYATDVLAMFLNFAALQFLQDVDNVAFEMAKSGYLSASLEKAANDVCATKLPSQRSTWRAYLDTIILGIIFCLLVFAWAAVNFLDTVEKKVVIPV